MSFLDSVKAFALLCLAFCLVTAGFFFIHLTVAVDQTAVVTQKSMVQVAKDADDLKEMTNATLYQAEETFKELSDMARVEKAAQTAQLADVDKVLTQLSITVQHLDASQAQVADSVSATLESVQPVMAQTQVTLAQVQETVKGMDKVIQDPDIPATLAHLNGTLSNVQDASKTLDDYVKRITKPRGFVSTLWHGLISLVAPGVAVARVVN